jgi:hypothetical protein
MMKISAELKIYTITVEITIAVTAVLCSTGGVSVV